MGAVLGSGPGPPSLVCSWVCCRLSTTHRGPQHPIVVAQGSRDEYSIVPLPSWCATKPRAGPNRLGNVRALTSWQPLAKGKKHFSNHPK